MPALVGADQHHLSGLGLPTTLPEGSNFLLWKQKETNNLQKNAEAQIQEQRKKGFQEGLFRGRLEGLTSGKKDYRALERERDAATRRARNARFAAIRRKKKEEN